MIRESIRAELDRRKWTVGRMCREAGVDPKHFGGYLKGTKEARSDVIESVLVTLGLKIVRR